MSCFHPPHPSTDLRLHGDNGCRQHLFNLCIHDGGFGSSLGPDSQYWTIPKIIINGWYKPSPNARFFFGLWHWLWHTLATYSYIKLTNLRYLSESIMVLSESHAHFGYNTGISSRFPAALLICFHWGSPPDPRDPSLPWWPWWPGDPSGKSRLWPWLISWWLPGLVNIQKAIENGYLWCIFPLIAWWFSSSLCKRLPEGKPAKRNHNIAERAAGRHRKNEWRFHQQNLADFTNRKVDSREQN